MVPIISYWSPWLIIICIGIGASSINHIVRSLVITPHKWRLLIWCHHKIQWFTIGYMHNSVTVGYQLIQCNPGQMKRNLKKNAILFWSCFWDSELKLSTFSYQPKYERSTKHQTVEYRKMALNASLDSCLVLVLLLVTRHNIKHWYVLRHVVKDIICSIRQ